MMLRPQAILMVAIAVFAAACHSSAPDVRAFPRVCPVGWTFLYTDHTVHADSGRVVICQKADSTLAGAIARR